MSTITERFNLVIAEKGLKKGDIAKRLGISGASVSYICSGRNHPSGQTVTMFCREYGVSREWLLYGTGEMYFDTAEDKEIEDFLEDTRLKPDFRRRLLAVLARINEDQWDMLEQFAVLLAEETAKAKKADVPRVVQPGEAPDPDAAGQVFDDEEAEVRDVVAQRREEREAADASSALRGTGSAPAEPPAQTGTA